MKQIYFRAALSMGIVSLLSGCAMPEKNPSELGFKKAVNAEAVQREVIRQYVPVPIPGQLMKAPRQASAAKNKKSKFYLSKEAAVRAANRKAKVVASSQDFFNAMMAFDYMPGAMYVIYGAPMQITDIVFEPGEKIISQAAGDTYRWQIAQTYSGEGENMQQHLLVKPNKNGLKNSVVVNTNRRVYHLILQSTDDDTYMVSVKWKYPKPMVSYYATEPGSGIGVPAKGAGYDFSLDSLDFKYKMKLKEGNRPLWYPTRVFTDGKQTFIEFPTNFNSSDMPILFVKADNGHYGTMVNWRMKGDYMVVDRVIHDARLQTGVDKTGKTIVEIKRGTG